MADETHKLQKEPAEGSRETVERELERQDRGSDNTGGKKSEPRSAGRPPREAKEPGAKTVR